MTTLTITVSETEARMILSAVSEPGDAELHALVKHVGAVAVLDMLVTPISGLNPLLTDRIRPRLGDESSALAILERLRVEQERHNIRVLTPELAGWPKGLNDLGDSAPLMLWVKGDFTALNPERSVAIVGARAATGYGEHVTANMAGALANQGYAIVSGAAYGIDGMAHRATLANAGTTIAFLAGGVDRFYPMGHSELLHRITETGAVVSEVAPGGAPTKHRFLQRNRLIAAFSQGMVVVEAGFRSGSLNAAGHATKLGRPLMAVPGPITSPASAGTARIIREGLAVLVTSATEVVETLERGE